MADDPNPTVSAQLAAAREVLAPQIRGMADLATTTISPDLRAKIQEIEAGRVRRDNLIVAAQTARDAYIAALTALEADGYPDLPNTQVANSLFDELQEEQADLQAAASVFIVVPKATTLAIELGAPVAKPKSP